MAKAIYRPCRAIGTDRRSLGINPRALNVNPRALGTNPKAATPIAKTELDARRAHARDVCRQACLEYAEERRQARKRDLDAHMAQHDREW